jgi:hypothetical protein
MLVWILVSFARRLLRKVEVLGCRVTILPNHIQSKKQFKWTGQRSSGICRLSLGLWQSLEVEGVESESGRDIGGMRFEIQAMGGGLVS